MAAFPSTQKFGWRDMGFDPEAAVERGAMERGIPKQRRISSDVRVELDLTLYFDTSAEITTFETFFFTTINAGQDFFDFTLPLYGGVVQARVVGGKLGPLSFQSRTLGLATRTLKIEYWRSVW